MSSNKGRPRPTSTSGADSGPGTLRAAIAGIVDTDPYNTIHIQVEEIKLQSQLSVAETGLVYFVGEETLPTVIRPDDGYEWQFRAMCLGIGDNSGNFYLSNLEFVKFSTDDDGGAIYNTGTLTVENCGFFENIAGDKGGAIASFGLDLTVTNCNFGYGSDVAPISGGNFAGEAGGAIYFAPGEDNSIEITGSVFQANEATLGAAVCSITLGTTAVDTTDFIVNEHGLRIKSRPACPREPRLRVRIRGPRRHAGVCTRC